MDGLPPTYGYFQSALADPQLVDMPATETPLHDLLPVSSQLESYSIPVKVTVHACPAAERTWFISRTLLAHHSGYFRKACEDSTTKSLDLTNCSLSAFQNLVDFMHSNIYSVNKRSPDYHTIHTHLQAWILGQKLEAPAYQVAALRALYSWVEPLARKAKSSAAKSPIRAEDVDFVCLNTEDDCVLRALLLDAVASHWTQLDTINVSVIPTDKPLEYGKALNWSDLYRTYPDFRKRISSSARVANSYRTDLLRPIEDYIAGKTSMKEDSGDETSVEALFGIRPKGLLIRKERMDSGGHMWSPSRRRESSVSSEGSQGRSSVEREVGEDEYMTADEA